MGESRTIDATVEEVQAHVPMKPGHVAKLRDHLWAHAARLQGAAAATDSDQVEGAMPVAGDEEPEALD